MRLFHYGRSTTKFQSDTIPNFRFSEYHTKMTNPNEPLAFEMLNEQQMEVLRQERAFDIEGSIC